MMKETNDMMIVEPGAKSRKRNSPYPLPYTLYSRTLILIQVLLLTTLFALNTNDAKSQFLPPGDMNDDTPFLGVYYVRITPYFAQQYNLKHPYGGLVKRIVTCTAAERHKLKPLDYIIAIDGREFSDMNDLRTMIRDRYKPKDIVLLTIIRNGKTITEKLQLGSIKDICNEPHETGCLGISYSMDSRNPNEMIISHVEPRSAADAMGVKAQDKLVALNGFPVNNPRDAQFVLEILGPEDEITVSVRRGRQKLEFHGSMGQCGVPFIEEKDTIDTVEQDTIIADVEPPKDSVENYGHREVVVKSDYDSERGYVKLRLWDHQQEDGDTVIIMLNDTVLLWNYPLRKSGKEIMLPLKKGSNTLKLVAVNLGKISPNTAAFKLDDGVKRKIVILKSDLGVTEAINIYYDPDRI